MPPTCHTVNAPRARRHNDSLRVALVIGLIMVSGNPAAGGAVGMALLPLLGACAALLPRRRQRGPFAGRYLVLSLVFAAVFAGQQLTLGFVSWPANAYFLAKMLVGGWVVYRIGPAFTRCLLQAVYLLSVPALVGYALLLTIGAERYPSLLPTSLLGENLKSLLFITVHLTPEWWRNSGPMWEPGAYQGIINLALFLAPADALFHPRHRGRLGVLLLALFTTFSTTGYIALFLIVFYRLLINRGIGMMKWPLIITVFAAGLLTYVEADFLGQKITEQLANSVNQEDFTPDRFGALLFDLHYIDKHPLIGNGFHDSTRFADHPWLQGEELGHGNGLSNFVASLGMIGLLAYGAGLATAGAFTHWYDRMAFCVIVAMLAFGEQFLVYPLFLALPFIVGLPTTGGHGRRQQAVLPTS